MYQDIKIIYIDSINGNDNNTGDENSPVKSLYTAFKIAPKGIKTIIIINDKELYNDGVIQNLDDKHIEVRQKDYKRVNFIFKNYEDNKYNYMKSITLGSNSILKFYNFKFTLENMNINSSKRFFKLYGSYFNLFEGYSKIYFNRCEFDLFDNKVIDCIYPNCNLDVTLQTKINFHYKKNRSIVINYNKASGGSLFIYNSWWYDKNGGLIRNYLNYIGGIKYDITGKPINLIYSFE